MSPKRPRTCGGSPRARSPRHVRQALSADTQHGCPEPDQPLDEADLGGASAASSLALASFRNSCCGKRRRRVGLPAQRRRQSAFACVAGAMPALGGRLLAPLRCFALCRRLRGQTLGIEFIDGAIGRGRWSEDRSRAICPASGRSSSASSSATRIGRDRADRSRARTKSEAMQRKSGFRLRFECHARMSLRRSDRSHAHRLFRQAPRNFGARLRPRVMQTAHRPPSMAVRAPPDRKYHASAPRNTKNAPAAIKVNPTT